MSIILNDGNAITVETLHSYFHFMLVTFGKLIVPKIAVPITVDILDKFVESYRYDNFPFYIDHSKVSSKDDVERLYFDNFPFTLDENVVIRSFEKITDYAIAFAVLIGGDSAFEYFKEYMTDSVKTIIESKNNDIIKTGVKAFKCKANLLANTV